MLVRGAGNTVVAPSSFRLSRTDRLAKIDGIAVSPSNAAAMAVALDDARRAQAPVVTFDSDLLPERRSLRAAYIGTNNYEIGVNLAKLVLKLKPDGGTSMHPVRRTSCPPTITSVFRRSAIRSRGRTKEYPDYRLTGEFGWTEVPECPIYTNEDFALAADQIADILAKYPKLDALIQTGGFAEVLTRCVPCYPWQLQGQDHER